MIQLNLFAMPDMQAGVRTYSTFHMHAPAVLNAMGTSLTSMSRRVIIRHPPEVGIVVISTSITAPRTLSVGVGLNLKLHSAVSPVAPCTCE